MTKSSRPDPFFVADDHALDFLNSVANPWGIEIEWIKNGQDFLEWLEKAGLVSASETKRFRKATSPKQLTEVAAQALKLREWFRAFVNKHAGRPLQSTALRELSTINRILARDNSFRQIEAGNVCKEDRATNKAALRWTRLRNWHELSPHALLLPLAEAMGDLICKADFTHVRMCENPTCSLWFHDISKNHTRRWCSMAVCGNRAKAAAHRAKNRSK